MPTDTRTSIDNSNLTAVFGASRSAGRTVVTGQAQFSTPTQWANYFAGLLPTTQVPDVFDPQCACGNLFTGFAWNTRRYGFEIDQRFDRMSGSTNPATNGRTFWSPAADQIYRIRGHCLDLWRTLDEVAPDLRFGVQVANPPFGALWKDEKEDSVGATWREIQKRAAPGGFGYFICPRSRAEALGLLEHERVYLVLHLPPGVFEGVGIEITTVFWMADSLDGASRPPRSTVTYTDNKPHSQEVQLRNVRKWFEGSWRRFDSSQMIQSMELLAAIVRDDEKPRPLWNLYIEEGGKLGFDMSMRGQLTRKLSPIDLKRLAGVNGQHPLSLIIEAETRKLLRELTEVSPTGDLPPYTVQPEARAAIERALASACTAHPVMPVTEFERVAYADELAGLTVRADYHPLHVLARGAGGEGLPILQPGKLYPISTHGYAFIEEFTRDRTHYDELTGKSEKVTHRCSLSGQDRYLKVIDDHGREHRFLDRPGAPDPKSLVTDHPESLFWEIFTAPAVHTVADAQPEIYQRMLQALGVLEGTMRG